ncbi:MAG: gluconate 2-dehydrogenase subunit 3 family protein [Solirubrobacterales bacterium]|nr:gluconate 2-dehydrogenase subunit 3 family protein [Solirubrobacterales bacterium]
MVHAFSDADHLPNRRPDGQPASPERLPRQRRGVTPQMHGRYPDFDAMSQQEHWDDATRTMVVSRVDQVPPIRFFTKDEAIALGILLDLALAQDREPRVPVLALVDAKLLEGKLDGFQHDDMPPDPETWRQVAAGLDATAVQHGFEAFRVAPTGVQEQIVGAFAAGELHGRVWDELPCAKAWGVVMRGALSEFYSHPWAWNEIGFGGPAYPRGYAVLGPGGREPWEGEGALDVDPVTDVRERGLE